MARFVRLVSPLALVALTMCQEASPGRPAVTAPGSAARVASDAAPATRVFQVDFGPLNNSGVKAEATLTVANGNLTVILDAVGRVPEHVHPQHIHGFTTKAASCPTAANDTNGDGVITFAEGLPSFGPVQVDLQPYPTPTNPAGETHYRMTFVASHVPFPPDALTQKVMVLHGDFFGGAYTASLPVACGVVHEATGM